MKNNRFLSVICSVSLASGAFAFDISDPYDVNSGVKETKSYSARSSDGEALKPMGLAELADFALKNNPQTQWAWLNALSKAQSVGLQKSAYLPSINASGTLQAAKQTPSQIGNGYSNSQNGSLSLSYVLYDFGMRDANLESTKRILDAAVASENAQVQSTFLTVVQAYFSFFGAKESLAAYLEAEKTARESYEAALAKYKAGTATPADKLQALTAYSQATLNRQKSEGTLKNSYAVLANTLGLEPNAHLEIIAPSVNVRDDDSLQSADKIIAEAKKARPDLAAAAAQVEAAKASIEAAKADGRPTVSLSSSTGFYDSSAGSRYNTANAAIAVNIPIFTGFSTTYKVAAAKIDVRLREAEYAKLQKQATLDAFTAYNNLNTQKVALATSKDMLASADESLKAASGRYKAGVGGILDLLSAQSAYASARQQNIEAAYNWYTAKAALLQSIGKLTFQDIEQIANGH